MQEQNIHHILATLKEVAQTTKDGGQTSAEALARVTAVLAQEGLRQIVGPAMGSPDDPALDAGRLLQLVVEAIERSGLARDDSREKARFMTEIGEILYVQGKWDEAIGRFRHAADISARIGYSAGRANALRQTGRICRRRGDWETAQKMLEEAVDLYQVLDDQAGKAEALLNLGNIQYEQGAYDEAEALFQEALIACEHLDSNQLTGDISMSLGVIRHVMGHHDEAIIHFTESLANFEVLADQRRISQACHNLGLAYADQGLWERAGMMYERALDIGRHNGEWSMVGLIYLCRSEMQALLADTAMAMGYAHKALEIFERLKDPLGQADTYKVFGRISGLKNAWKLAEEFLNESQRLQREHGSRLGEAEVEEVRGWLHERQQNSQEAMAAYQRAMVMFHEMKAMGRARRVRDTILHLQETMDNQN